MISAYHQNLMGSLVYVPTFEDCLQEQVTEKVAHVIMDAGIYITGGYHVPKGPKIGFPCVYVLNKPKTMKKYIGGTSRGEI